LAAVVAVEQVTPAAGSWHTGSRHVEDRAELLLKPAPGREAGQILSGEGILSGHPLPSLRGVGILQPAIGIADLDVMQGFDDQASFRVRVTHIRLPGSKAQTDISVTLSACLAVARSSERGCLYQVSSTRDHDTVR
jgi:hypothetical protein